MIDASFVKARAADLGFLGLGVAAADRPPHYDAYLNWIDAGNQGEMDYLERHTRLKVHPDRLLDGCRSVIAVSLSYSQPNPAATGQPRIARYALGRDYHRVLRSKLRTLQGRLAEAYPHARWRICVDSAPLMERDFAHMAGLGWFGKNTCLIDSKSGSWFVLGFLLSDLTISPDQPAIGGCGTCQKCIDACPTDAIAFRDGRWQVLASRCVSYLTIEHQGDISEELKAGVGDWTFGCDICQEVCPFNEPRPSQPLRARTTEEEAFLERRRWPSLMELAQIKEGDWDVLTRGSPVRRSGYAGLLRNAALNIQNMGPETPK